MRPRCVVLAYWSEVIVFEENSVVFEPMYLREGGIDDATTDTEAKDSVA